MIWLIKKIIGLGIFIAIVFFIMNYQVGGKPIKDLFSNFYQSPFAQEAVRQGRESFSNFVGAILHKDPSSAEVQGLGKPMDSIDDDDRHELEQLIKKK
jgi:hypothetical protein